MSTKQKQGQVTALKSILDLTYNPINKVELDKDTIKKELKKCCALLKNLPPILQQFFGDIVINILKDYEENKNYDNAYNIVWFGMKLMSIYKGSKFKPLLSSDWEYEYDFYDRCKKMLHQFDQ